MVVVDIGIGGDCGSNSSSCTCYVLLCSMNTWGTL